jgi:hypothetical protein
MMQVIWVKIRSWHAVENHALKTLCGRQVQGEVQAAVLPGGKSCESCLRIIARQRYAESTP